MSKKECKSNGSGYCDMDKSGERVIKVSTAIKDSLLEDVGVSIFEAATADKRSFDEFYTCFSFIRLSQGRDGISKENYKELCCEVLSENDSLTMYLFFNGYSISFFK